MPIHYLGDEKAVTPYPHGNAKIERDRPYTRTCPYVLKSLKKECKMTTATKAHRKHITYATPSTHLSVKQPPNTEHVKNVQSKVLAKQRLSHDAIYNLHEIAIDIPDFIHVIHTYLNFICVCGQKSIFDELDRLLLLDSPSPQVSYDTTFQLGDFYVPTLAFQHVLFK